MSIGWCIGLVLWNTLSLVLVVIGLPGNWLMLAAALILAWMHWQSGAGMSAQVFHPATLVVGLGLAFIGEVLELVAGAAGARRMGGSRWGAAGALLGGLVGGIAGTFIIPVPLIGSLLGAGCGAAVGAWSFEIGGGRDIESAARIGVSAGIGRILGTLYKAGVGVALWIVLAVAAFWP